MRASVVRWTGLAFLALAACNSGPTGNGGTPPPPPPPQPPPPPPAVPGADVTIQIGDNFFLDPDGGRNTNASVTIDVGQTVGWRNGGSLIHTSTSGEGVNGQDGDGLPQGATGFDRTLQPGEEFTHTFGVAGTYTYYCQIHGNEMFNATIIVQ